MFPTLGDLLAINLPIDTHAFFVGVGVTVAAIFMRLGTWLQHADLRDNATLAEQWAYGNRSIIGGLFGAWLGVHVTKRLTGYRHRTGDLFAPAVAAGMAVGRVACLLTETPGTPCPMCALGANCAASNGVCGIGLTLDPAAAARFDAPDGAALHASFVYEIVFHALAFALLWWFVRKRLTAPGESFVLYIAGYAIFRFFVEFVRGNEIAFAGLTRPQLVLAVTIPIILARITYQARRGTYDSLLRPAPALQ
ncbi:diacylglyceryl transferase [Bowdeniella nasicola]|uniref:Diacylglyceryl transferase n=1 Tax=Bowdeniella nasicola TaxID=208480 RepID=A0A1Q5Q5B3_9ACTO|nr:prolipoprotein diacylglyceryl transferase family protein [Bowdeniella nasicola]OKL55017.1 diacylglyceryl transferase [Bowdeniella nasicola]